MYENYDQNLESMNGNINDSSSDVKVEKKILVLGLDGAGKSSLLAYLSKTNTWNQPIQTDGFNVVCVNTENGLILNFWEIGGSQTIRNYWMNFIQGTDLLIYIVDTTDDERLPEAAAELHKLLQDNRLKNVPLLILANKQDLPAAKDLDIVSGFFDMHKLKDNLREILPLQVPILSSANDNITSVRNKIISTVTD